MAVKWADIHKNIIDHAIVSGIPASGFFELTSRCNFHCKMCYICTTPEDKSFLENEMTASQWISIGEQARDAGLVFLTLTGGEIFLRKDFFEIYEAYSEMGFNIVLFTNGSLITPDKVKKIARKPPSKISITLYGASPETYGRVTGHPEGFENTLSAVRALLTENIKVELKTTVIKDNYEEFRAISNIAENLGVHLGIVNYIGPRREGCGTDPENNRLDPVVLAKYEKMILEYNREKREATKNETKSIASIDNDVMTDIPDDLDKDVLLKLNSQSAFRCSATKCAFWLTWDGRLTPCGLLNEPFADVKKIGFVSAWESLREAGTHVPACRECKDCNYRIQCIACPARLKVETGSFIKPAPYLCELAKARTDLNVHY